MFGTVNSCVNILISTAFTTLLISSTGCKQNTENSGGDCYYETVETLAEVIDMRPHPDGNGKIAIILEFKASVLALENQELGDLKGYQIDHKFLKRNHIDMGNKYSVTVSELTKGNCETKLTVAFDHGFQ